MADLRVGLIGIGGMGGCHYGNYKDVKGAKLVAVADVRVDMAKEKTKKKDYKLGIFGEKYQLHVYLQQSLESYLMIG